MSFRRRVRKFYIRLKHSRYWHSNWFLEALYPVFILVSRVLIFFYRKVYFPGRNLRALKGRAWKKITSFSLNTILFKTARFLAYNHRWLSAKQVFAWALSREYRRKKTKLENINEAKFNLSVISRLINIEGYKRLIAKYNNANLNPRIAVYTAIAGGYDSVKAPEVLLPGIDYFLFTDMPAADMGFLKIRPLPYYHIDTPRMARYVKTHPHQLLTGYDIAIWVDANILITGDITPMIEGFVKSKKAVGAVPHPLRKSLGEEAEACIFYNKDDERQIKEQMAHYKSLNYETNELIESNIMLFDLRGLKLSSFFATWWTEIDKYTRRDQLSLNYSLDKNKISWHKIMKRPQDARNHPLFTLVPHRTRYSCVSALIEAMGSKVINPYAGPSFESVKGTVVNSQLTREVDIVYCVHDALEDVKVCLASVVKNRKSDNLKLIIVDDASGDATATYLKDFAAKHEAWVKIIRKENAGGYTKAANTGLKASTGELVILLNSDTIVTNGWSEKMADAVFSTPGAGIVGPLSSAASHQSIPDHIGTRQQTATNELPRGLTAEELNRYCEKWAVAGYYPRVPLVHGFCFGITREVIEKIGYFDEKSFPSGYGEENDYCFRAAGAGFSLVIATNTYVFHAKSKSYPDERRIKLMRQGTEKQRGLWGKERIERAIKSVLANPTLQTFRDNARNLYRKHGAGVPSLGRHYRRLK